MDIVNEPCATFSSSSSELKSPGVASFAEPCMEPVAELGAEPVATRKSKRQEEMADEETKRKRGVPVVAPPSNSFRFSLWPLAFIKDQFRQNGISEEELDTVIRWFVILMCASHWCNPTKFLVPHYTVMSLLLHLYVANHLDVNNVSLISTVSDETSFNLLIAETLTLHEYIQLEKPNLIAELVAIADIRAKESENLDEWYSKTHEEFAQDRENARAHQRRAGRTAGKEHLSPDELVEEEAIIANEKAQYDAEVQRFEDENPAPELVPLDDIIELCIELVSQVKKRGPKDKTLKKITNSASLVIKSIIVLQVSHRDQLVNVKLIFNTLRYAKFADVQLKYAIEQVHPDYRKILFVSTDNTNAFKSYSASKWVYTDITLPYERFHPKYDGRFYLCMTPRGAQPP